MWGTILENFRSEAGNGKKWPKMIIGRNVLIFLCFKSLRMGPQCESFFHDLVLLTDFFQKSCKIVFCKSHARMLLQEVLHYAHQELIPYYSGLMMVNWNCNLDTIPCCYMMNLKSNAIVQASLIWLIHLLVCLLVLLYGSGATFLINESEIKWSGSSSSLFVSLSAGIAMGRWCYPQYRA